MYELSKKNSNLDYAKKEILLIQENLKVFFPLLLILFAALAVINVTHAVFGYLPLYLFVVIDIIGIGTLVGLLIKSIGSKKRQKNLFEQLSDAISVEGAAYNSMSVVQSSVEAVCGGARVKVYDTPEAYVVLPDLPSYSGGLFTRYDFRGDFGRLTLAKSEYEKVESGSTVHFVSASGEFTFASVAK